MIYAKEDSVLSEWILNHLQNGGALVADSSVNLQPFTHYSKQLFRVEHDLEEILANTAAADKNFSMGGYSMTERVALLSKNQIRKDIVCALRAAFHSQNLPYVHLWYYPKGYKSMFSFRFDMDEYHPEDHKMFIQLLKEAKGSVSCFACMKTYESLPEAIREVRDTGVEIGSHAYVHHIYNNDAQNVWNISRAEELLEVQGIGVSAFSAPHGKWNASLQSVLETRGYTYSSEFSLDYDNFPFFPYTNGRFSKVLQIPTHTVCEGVFLQKYDYNLDMFRDYYNAVIEHKLRNYEPIIIFGHPTRRLGRYPDIFRNIYKKICAYPEIWRTELHTFAQWWKDRHDVALSIKYDSGKILTDDAFSDVYQLHVIFPDGHEEWINSDGQSEPAAADRDMNGKMPEETLVKYGLLKRYKLILKDWLDWENKTPAGKLLTPDLRTAIKKILRQIF